MSALRRPSSAAAMRGWCEFCWMEGGTPFNLCRYCGDAPSWHHGRCCPLKPFRGDWCEYCQEWGRFPFGKCWFCRADPAWHHGRCCPFKAQPARRSDPPGGSREAGAPPEKRPRRQQSGQALEGASRSRGSPEGESPCACNKIARETLSTGFESNLISTER